MAPGLSYREKTLYASLVAEILVYGPYFFLHQQNSVNKVAGMIIAIIILQVVLQLVIAAFTRNRTTDERDRLIELRGYRAGYLMVASLMVLGLAMLWFHTAMGQLHLDNPKIGLHFLSVFFGMLVIADITKTATQIVAYRRAI
jgi:EamA domain-containing membrane protein RarD